jgi:hypothetical protein
MVSLRMINKRATSSGVYLRCEPAVRADGPSPYRRSQVRNVAGATPSLRATVATARPAAGIAGPPDEEAGQVDIIV